MNQRSFNAIAIIVFIIAGSLHLIRSMAGWELVLNGFAIPIWLSLVVSALLVYLIFTAITLNKK